jgi:hypothetical protein
MRRLRVSRSATTGKELAALAIILAGMVLLSVGPVLIHTCTTEPDLFARVVRVDARAHDPRIIDWPSLVRNQHDTHVRVLGYMMDHESPIADGKSVSRFVLLSETGSLLHPAHRIPGEMLSVSLRNGTTTQFRSRSLVWAEGNLTPCYVSPRASTPRHCLSDATVEAADRGDIARFFANP